MDRRRIRVGLFTSSFLGSHSWAGDDDDPSRRPVGRSPNSKPSLTHTGAIASQFAGEVIENLDILSLSGDEVTITHPGVLVRKCRIRHAGGHKADGEKALRFEPLEIVHGGATSSGEGANADTHIIDLASCPNAILTRIIASKEVANLYLEDCERASLSRLELHDARGPELREQNVQFNRCRNSTLEDFSAENGPSSWTEDNVSVFHSDSTSIRQGLVSCNDSPSAVGPLVP
jgi:polygalacturonase